MIGRREWLRAGALSLLAGALPRFVFAETPADTRFVLVVLRGAADGLALAPPWGEGPYARLRGPLALGAPGSDGGVLKLDGLFGLHPALPTVHALYGKGEAAVLHAVATPYRERSHFDGQDLLESGGARTGRVRDGWLNRALAERPGGRPKSTAVAVAQTPPLVARGDAPVTTWAPSRLPDAGESTLHRLADLYAGDALLAPMLAEAMMAREITGEMDGSASRGRRAGRSLAPDLEAAARFLAAPDGPRIAVVEAGGWDTHANQGAAQGQLAIRLADLDAGIAAFRDGIGPHWARSVVLVVTEFGRTARVNGTRGTDHGTAGAALLAGGAVNGGRVVADWPGLGDRDLFEGRDLAPTLDLRRVFKGLLAGHLGVGERALDTRVFPDSPEIRPLEGLLRA